MLLLLQQLSTYKNLILQISLALTLSVLLSFLNLPVFFLHSLHTYIHPDHIPSSSRAAIRRPDSSADPSHPELRKRPKTKSNNKASSSSPFDESNAQIFRLKLDGAHLLSRLFFSLFSSSFSLSAVALSSLALHLYLSADVTTPLLIRASFIPLLLSLAAVANLLAVLAKLSAEKSASRKSEKHLAALFGVLGLVLASFNYSPEVLDFELLRKVDEVSGTVLVAVVTGCIAGFMFIPGAKSGRAFWLGTDQARSGLSMMSCEWFGRIVLYARHGIVLFTVALWINPLGGLLVKKNDNVDGNLFGNVGFSREDFAEFRIWCLLVSGLVQVVAVRPSLQMYLNEALLCWYQRLHAGKVPDLEFSRAKVFLHNHYLCLAVLQFMAPPLMVLLFVGLSRVDGVSLDDYKYACSVLPCSVFVREVAVFFAWWILFVWAVYSSVTIFLYRWCVLTMS